MYSHSFYRLSFTAIENMKNYSLFDFYTYKLVGLMNICSLDSVNALYALPKAYILLSWKVV